MRHGRKPGTVPRRLSAHYPPAAQRSDFLKMKPRAAKPKTQKCRVTFTIVAPEAVEVCLGGAFNAWQAAAHPMKPTGNGAWQKTMLLPSGEYAYKFRLDGTWLTDPTTPCIRPNCYGTYNSVLTVASV